MKNVEEIRQLIKDGETHNVEFKARFQPDNVGEALCALANDWPETGEGILVIGVNPKTWTVDGFPENEDELQQSIANVCRDAISPPLAPSVHIVHLEKPVMVAEMKTCSGRPYRHRGSCYIRIGTTTRRAIFDEESELKRRASAEQERLILRQRLGSGEHKCDVPPVNNKWVGRAKELAALSDPSFKVIFITGIGGQGKSGLASHYVTNTVAASVGFEYWDWRDLKEEEHRLHSKLVSVIERLTDGAVAATHLKDRSIEDVVETLFQHLGSRRIVFVFDNIDHYIDTETFLPAGGMEKFVDYALGRDHNSKFIFTCRPYIKCAAVAFLQLNLGGLSSRDTVALFNTYMIPMKQDEQESLAKEAHELTRGHPLWLNLVAAQAVRGKDNAYRFVDGIKFSHSLDEFSVLTENVLRTVWDTLNQSQRVLLRAMSETVRAEREEVLQKMLSDVLHAHRFYKALRVLKSLNLIVVKSAPKEPDLLELHPLVKTFVKQKYTLGERIRYITLLVNHYTKLIVLWKPKLGEHSNLSTFEYWIDKVELDINKGDFRSALSSLDEIAYYLLAWGHVEEYLRIADKLFTEIDWGEASGKGYPSFHPQFRRYTHTTIEFGDSEKAGYLLDKYEPLAKDSDFEEYCNLRCYYYWYLQDFNLAIKWGQRYRDMIRISKPTSATIRNSLLLAWRDSQQVDNLEKALNGFLGSEKMEDVLSADPPRAELDPAFYGNVGRCLWYQNRLGEALICCKKSMLLLNQERDTDTIINRGYASYWIAQILAKQDDTKDACLLE